MKPLARLYHAVSAGAPLVLGLRMRPATVGHMVILSRLGNPLAKAGPLTVEELTEAAFLLSDDWREIAERLARPFPKLEFKLWAWFKLRKADWNGSAAALTKWVWDREGELAVLRSSSSDPLEAAGPERLLLSLVHIGLTADEALDLPLIDAERLVLTWAEAQGHVKLNGEHHQALKARADAEYARVMAEIQAHKTDTEGAN